MGRREMRAELQSTWATYTPRTPGKPFRKKDIEDAADVFEGSRQEPAKELPDMTPTETLRRAMLGRLGQ